MWIVFFMGSCIFYIEKIVLKGTLSTMVGETISDVFSIY